MGEMITKHHFFESFSKLSHEAKSNSYFHIPLYSIIYPFYPNLLPEISEDTTIALTFRRFWLKAWAGYWWTAHRETILWKWRSLVLLGGTGCAMIHGPSGCDLSQGRGEIQFFLHRNHFATSSKLMWKPGSHGGLIQGW